MDVAAPADGAELLLDQAARPLSRARVCAVVEVDPAYVDVAVRDWEQFSGDLAERADG